MKSIRTMVGLSVLILGFVTATNAADSTANKKSKVKSVDTTKVKDGNLSDTQKAAEKQVKLAKHQKQELKRIERREKRRSKAANGLREEMDRRDAILRGTKSPVMKVAAKDSTKAK